MTFFIILVFAFILLVGFAKLHKSYLYFQMKLSFAFEYRDKFIEFANNYIKEYNAFLQSGNINNELYVWLTKNVNKIQSEMGYIGIMDYNPPFQNHIIKNYHLILNTIPKFRAQSVKEFDVNSTDDSLLRYIGFLEEKTDLSIRNLKNPILWFRYGIQTILSGPLLFLNWFGIIKKKQINKITENIAFKFVSGMISLIGFLSALVTIITGQKEVAEFFKKIFGNG